MELSDIWHLLSLFSDSSSHLSTPSYSLSHQIVLTRIKKYRQIRLAVFTETQFLVTGATFSEAEVGDKRARVGSWGWEVTPTSSEWARLVNYWYCSTGEEKTQDKCDCCHLFTGLSCRREDRLVQPCPSRQQDTVGSTSYQLSITPPHTPLIILIIRVVRILIFRVALNHLGMLWWVPGIRGFPRI